MAWTPNRILALVIGIVFTLIGILGFFVAPGMQEGSLMGFSVDVIHNLVHLITGLVALAAAFTGWSRRFNQVFGVVYLLVGILGLIPALYFDNRLLGLMHINGADNILHLVVGIACALVGFLVAEEYAGTARQTVNNDPDRIPPTPTV